MKNLLLYLFLKIRIGKLKVQMLTSYLSFSKKLEPEFLFLSDYLKGVRLGIDVGANRGIYTYLLSKVSEEVISFEPQGAFAEVISGYHLKNVRVLNCALSNTDGISTLKIPVSGGRRADGLAHLTTSSELHDSSDYESVKTSTLDSYHLAGVDFIKIDVEGFEYQVLSGSLETIASCLPFIMVEIEERHTPGNIQKIYDMLTEYSYECFYVKNGTLEKLSQHEIVLLSRQDNLLDSKKIINFIFKI